MRKNVEQAMDALFAGKNRRPSHSVFTEQRGESYRDGDGPRLPTVYSYGYHFPLVILSADGEAAYLNEEKYSVTTSNQQSSAGYYLHLKGFRSNGQTIVHRGHEYCVYRRAAAA